MSHPFFSFVVPTRNRPQLADPTIARLLQQTWTDFEIVVLENSDRPSLKYLEERDRRIRVVSSTQTLSMPDNWQRGLELARGRYLLYMSDKDWVVRSALEELVAVIKAQKEPDVINIRRSVWFPPDSLLMQGLLMQQGSGEVAVLPSRNAIQHWFDTATNQMNTPMIYNSAVRREFVDGVRQRYNGRLFYGNSPDVGSGQILLSATPTYVIFDRVITMAMMGPWSIGWATITKGRSGAAEGFATEFGQNPLDRYGLVWCLSGVVVETLLACKNAEPERLKDFDINWSAYFKECFDELERRESGGEDVSADRQKLRTGSPNSYSRMQYLKALALRRTRHQRRWLGAHAPFKYVMPPYDGWRRRLGLPTPAALAPAITYVDKDCFRPLVPSPTPEDAFAYLVREQYGANSSNL